MRFLGLRIGDDVPDAKTIWSFQEELKERRLINALFDRFDQLLFQAGFIAKGGQIADASIVKMSARRDSREVNEQLRRARHLLLRGIGLTPANTG